MQKIQEKNNWKNVETSSIVEVLYGYIRHWKWFIASILACCIIGMVFILVTQKQYKTSLSILLNEDKNKSKGTSEIDLDALGLLSTTNNIDNEIVILASPDLVRQVVDTLNLQSSYYIKDKLRIVELFKKAPFRVQYKDIAKESYLGQIKLEVIKDDSSFEITGQYLKNNGEKLEIKHDSQTLPTSITLPENLGIINIEDTGENIIDSKTYYVEINNTPSVAASQICSNLMINSTSKGSSVLNISLIVGNTEKGAAILNELVRQYNIMNVKVNNEIANNTFVFINERLKEISIELEDVEDEVVSYKKKNRITDLSTEAQLFVQQTGQNEQKLIDVETQLNIMSLIEKFVNDPSKEYSLIPNLEVSDPGLSQIISDYNKKLLSGDQLIKNIGEENPSRRRLIEDINNTRVGIANSISNVKQAYNIVKQDLQKQSQSTKNRISSVPQQEKGLFEKARLQHIKESLFLFLMQKREETAISIASTAEKARIVIAPTTDGMPIAPKSRIILLASLILGFLTPIIIIYIAQLFNTKISNRSELERLSEVTILGEICKNDTESQIVVQQNDNSSIAEMFRSLRNKINFIFKHEDNKIILVTSTMSNEGKTFISLNLALSFILSKKKVLLIGVDVRNPKLGKYLDMNERRGLTDYLVGPTDNWKDYVYSTKNSGTLDVMISGTIPPNPNELLMDPKFKTLLSQVKQEYDFIILDTAPVGLVSDTYLIDKHIDLTLYVVRENATTKAAINFINKQKEEESLQNMYIVYNDTNFNTGYKYGYGKGYGYEKKNK